MHLSCCPIFGVHFSLTAAVDPDETFEACSSDIGSCREADSFAPLTKWRFPDRRRCPTQDNYLGLSPLHVRYTVRGCKNFLSLIDRCLGSNGFAQTGGDLSFSCISPSTTAKAFRRSARVKLELSTERPSSGDLETAHLKISMQALVYLLAESVISGTIEAAFEGGLLVRAKWTI